MAYDNRVYSRHHLCPYLRTRERCFVVQCYNQGNFDQVFHEHVPLHRISQESTVEVLCSLVGHYDGWSGLFILNSRLNNRRGGPSRYPSYVHHISYPEEGVIRHYVSSGSILAWSDAVLSPEIFRPMGMLDEQNCHR
jgi:hypothetical protein